MLSGLLWLCPVKGTRHVPRGQFLSLPWGPGQGRGAISALCSPTHFHPIQLLVFSHLAPALPLLMFPRAWEPSCGLLLRSLGSGACAGVCAGAGLGSMLCTAGAGCSFPLHRCGSTPIFLGCLFFVGCGDGGTCLGVSVNPGHGVLSLEWWLLGSDPVLLGAGEGRRAGWCLLGRGMRRCSPEIFGSDALSLAAGRVPTVPFGAPIPWHCWVAVEAEA